MESCRVQTCCLTGWHARHCRFSLFRPTHDVQTKSEVRQRCDDRKSETKEQRQMFTASQTVK